MTARYNDMTKGACGCGSEPNPPDFWTKSKFTAAGNAMMVGCMFMAMMAKFDLFNLVKNKMENANHDKRLPTPDKFSKVRMEGAISPEGW